MKKSIYQDYFESNRKLILRKKKVKDLPLSPKIQSLVVFLFHQSFIPLDRNKATNQPINLIHLNADRIFICMCVRAHLYLYNCVVFQKLLLWIFHFSKLFHSFHNNWIFLKYNIDDDFMCIYICSLSQSEKHWQNTHTHTFILCLLLILPLLMALLVMITTSVWFDTFKTHRIAMNWMCYVKETMGYL